MVNELLTRSVPRLGAPRLGDHIALDDLAATLEQIAAQGPDGFYKGRVAEQIAAAVQEMGGRMTVDDLANYRAVEREPVEGTYRGHEIVSMPPPSSGGDANAPGPLKRPLSSMSPTFVLKDGQIELATGSPGGSHIITTVLQILVDVLDHGLNVAEATDAPRAHDQLWPDEIMVERGFSPDTIRMLEAMGHKVTLRPHNGSANSIARASDGTLTGASDPRQRGTLAVGY